MTPKQFEKITKKLIDSVMEEMDAMDTADLQRTIAEAEEAIATAKKEMEKNPEYQRAKEAVSDLSRGMKDTKAYQNAKIQYCLLRLKEQKGDDLGELEAALEAIRFAVKSRKPDKKAS